MFKVDDVVNFHSIIGGEVTSTGHVIESILMMPNNFGCDVAWVTGKSGCVAIAALSNESNPMQKPLTKSQKRYRAYLQADCTETFGEWLKNCYWDDYRRRNYV